MSDRKSLMTEAWQNSIPVDKGGLAATYGVVFVQSVIDDIARYDGRLRLMFDKRRQVVTLWRLWEGDGRPVIQFDSPFALVVDQRLLEYIARADMRNLILAGKALDEVTTGLDAENAKVAKERWEETWGKVDHALYAYHARRAQAELHGDRVIAPSAVPADLTATVPADLTATPGSSSC